MSLITDARIERENESNYFSDRNKLEQQKLKYIPDDNLWIIRRLAVNIVLRQNPRNIHSSWIGPFEWDKEKDIIYMGLGNYNFRRSDYETKLQRQINNSGRF